MSFKRFRRILVRLLTVVVILATAGSIGLYGYRAVFGYHYDSSLSGEDLSAGIQADENITNIALFGLDTRPGDEKSHSDCMMIVTIDNTRGKIKLSSLMRDSLVEIDGVVEDYIAVNFEQVVEIVDALDGIEINVASEAELTELNRVIRDYGLEQGKEFSPVEKTGLQTLDGVQALCYGRIRKGNTGDDWSRVERQSVVLNAMFAKISSMDANGLLGIMNRLMPYVTTSLAPADIAPLIVGAVKNGVPAVEHVRFPLDGEWKYYGSSNEYIMYDVDVVADELHEYIYNDVTPGTAASAGSDGSTDSDDPADSTTGTSSPAAGSHKTETVDPESLVEEGGSYDASTGDYYDSDGDRYYLDENGNRVYY